MFFFHLVPFLFLNQLISLVFKLAVMYNSGFGKLVLIYTVSMFSSLR